MVNSARAMRTYPCCKVGRVVRQRMLLPRAIVENLVYTMGTGVIRGEHVEGLILIYDASG